MKFGLFSLLFFLSYLKGGVGRDRWRENFVSAGLPSQMAAIARAGPGWHKEPVASFSSSMWVGTGTQSLGPSSTAFPRPVTGWEVEQPGLELAPR